MSKTVAVSIPPKTAVPKAFLADAPTPVAMTNGKTPKIKVKEVIKMGLKRSVAALKADS